jgi:phage tail sheath protein FI
MPVQTTYPGVYVEERPSGVRTIVGVSTSVTAFVGAAQQGPVGEAVRVFSVADYTRRFGRPSGAGQPMGYAVAHFFANGGSQALVVRVVGKPPAPATGIAVAALSSAAPAVVLNLGANGAGTWANRAGSVGLEVAVDYNDTSNPADLFTLTIRLRAPDARTGAAVVTAEDTYRDLSLSTKHPRYVRRVLAASPLVLVTGPTPQPAGAVQATSTSGALAANVQLPFPDSVVRVAVNHGPPADLLLFAGLTQPQANKSRADIAARITAALAAAGLGATAAVAGSKIVITTTQAGADHTDTAVTVTPAPSNDASQALRLGMTWRNPSAATLADEPTEVSGAAALRPVAGTTGFAGGLDVTPNADDLIPPAGAGGLYALDALEFPRFNLLCVPELPASDPVTDAPGLRSQALSRALSYCVTQRAFLVVDTPAGWPVAPQPNVGGLAALGEHGAIYYPRVTVVEAGAGGLPVTLDLPASGAVAGIMARTDSARGVWKAPAGLEAGIVGISGITETTDDNLSGQLNPRGVNVLRTFPGAGTVVWGARTLKGADSQASEHKYIPVRRLTDYIASSLYLGTQFAVFEPNDPDLWAQLRLAVGTFMRGLYRQGAFQDSPTKNEADSFFVVCDETVNPQSEIDLGRVNVLVGFAPLKPAEFVVITITQISKLEA